jgi:outer membrane protein, multidrug efflux system
MTLSFLSKPRWFTAGTLSFALVAIGCAVGPNHEAPEIKSAPNHRGDKQPTATSLADLPWWEVYRDPALFALIKEATEKSLDLRIALSRVEIARQAHRSQIWQLAPTIGVQGGVGDGLGSLEVPSLYPPVQTSSAWGAGVGASWEPDVWGRLRRLTQVAKYNLEAADEDRRGVYVALVGDVAVFYFELVAADLQKAYAEEAVATRRQTLNLFEARSLGGVGNDLEVTRARAAVSQAEGTLAAADLAIATRENALSLLLARIPGAVERQSSIEALKAPPAVPAGLPSTLLQRRPDIRVAEKQLRAANARIGAELADYFPKFQLTAFMGVASPDLTEASFVRGGAGLFNWTLPFLGGESVRAEHKAAIANWELSTAAYERTVLSAFREVADSLATIHALTIRRVALDAQLTSLEDAEELAVQRYQGGVANYLDVLTTQEQLLITQLSIADIRGQEQAAVARLYRNLGGGWPLPDEDEEDEDEKKDGATPAEKKSGG